MFWGNLCLKKYISLLSATSAVGVAAPVVVVAGLKSNSNSGSLDTINPDVPMQYVTKVDGLVLIEDKDKNGNSISLKLEVNGENLSNNVRNYCFNKMLNNKPNSTNLYWNLDSSSTRNRTVLNTDENLSEYENSKLLFSVSDETNDEVVFTKEISFGSMSSSDSSSTTPVTTTKVNGIVLSEKEDENGYTSSLQLEITGENLSTNANHYYFNKMLDSNTIVSTNNYWDLDPSSTKNKVILKVDKNLSKYENSTFLFLVLNDSNNKVFEREIVFDSFTTPTTINSKVFSEVVNNLKTNIENDILKTKHLDVFTEMHSKYSTRLNYSENGVLITGKIELIKLPISIPIFSLYYTILTFIKV